MIREATLQDIPAMLEIYRPYVEHTAYSFEYETPDLAAFTRRYEAVREKFIWLVWEENGEILGYCYADRAFERAAYQWAVDLSIYLLPSCHGRGIGRALYTCLEQWLRRQGYLIAYAVVTSDNEVSCAFHRAMGYQAVAELPQCGWKLGQWHGITWFEKRLGTQTPPQPLFATC